MPSTFQPRNWHRQETIDGVMQQKEGEFDWIISYDAIRSYFEASFTGIDLKSHPKLLVIGCGTSPMSALLARDFEQSEIISIDYDDEVIKHMRKECGQNARLKWYRYDVVEDGGCPQGNELDIPGYFDMVIDKGTLDAILVGGCVYKMLVDVHRKLRVGGVYVIFSINKRALLEALLGLPELNFELAYFEDVTSKCSVLLCKKRTNHEIDVESLAEREEIVMDQYFQSENPLVTPELEAQLRRAFAVAAHSTCGDSGGFIPLQMAHEIMFVRHNKHLFYTFDLFSEDLAHIELTHRNMMSIDEALQFLRDMQ